MTGGGRRDDFLCGRALAALLAACSDDGSSDSTGSNMNQPVVDDKKPEIGDSGVINGDNDTGNTDTLSLSERLAQDGAEVSLGGYQLEGGSSYMVAGRNVTVSGGNADGAAFVVKADGVTFSNVRGIGSLVVDEEVGEGNFSAEGCEVSTMLVNGGGANSVHITGGKMGDILVLKKAVRIALAGTFDDAVKGIYSLAGEFKGTIDTASVPSLKIEKADARIAAKAEGADIENKNAAVPPAAMEAVLETVDILSGRGFAEYKEEVGEPKKLNMACYFAEDGKWCIWNSYDHGEQLGDNPTLATLKNLADQNLSHAVTSEYKYRDGVLAATYTNTDAGEDGVPATVSEWWAVTADENGLALSKPEGTYRLSGSGNNGDGDDDEEEEENYVNPGKKYAEIWGSFEKDNKEYSVVASAEGNVFSGSESSGTIRLSGTYNIYNHNDDTEKEDIPFAAPASYSVSGDTMTLTFTIDGTEFTLTGGLLGDDSKEVWTEVK